MANYNFYANYGSPQGGGREQDQLSQVLQLYNMVQQKREKQLQQVEKYGAEMAANAEQRGKLEMFKDQSEYLTNFLNYWDEVDNMMSSRLYEKLGKGNLSRQDLADVYKWKQDRAQAYTHVNMAMAQYQKDLQERGQLDSQSRGQYVYKNSEINFDDYFTNPRSMLNANAGTTTAVVSQNVSALTKSILTQLEQDIDFRNSEKKGILEVLKKYPENWDTILNAAIQNGGAEAKGQATKLLEELGNGIKGIKENYDYDSYDELGKQKLDNAIRQGVFQGMVPREINTMSDPTVRAESSRYTAKQKKEAFRQLTDQMVHMDQAQFDALLNDADMNALKDLETNFKDIISNLGIDQIVQDLKKVASVKEYIDAGQSSVDLKEIVEKLISNGEITASDLGLVGNLVDDSRYGKNTNNRTQTQSMQQLVQDLNKFIETIEGGEELVNTYKAAKERLSAVTKKIRENQQAATRPSGQQ